MKKVKKVGHLYRREGGTPPPLGTEALCGHIRDDERPLAEHYTICSDCHWASEAVRKETISDLNYRLSLVRLAVEQ